MPEIFINYRTSDEPLAALLIDQALTAILGADRVFRDHRSIPLGVHFPPEIWEAVQSCSVFLAVIGRRWLDPDDAGRRRIDDPRDYVRREIAEVLRRRIAVIPVLVGDTALPSPDLLPADIAGLSSRQYAHLRLRGAEYDIDRLVSELHAVISRAGPTGTPGAASADAPAGPPIERPAAEPPPMQFVFHERVKADVIGIAYNQK